MIHIEEIPVERINEFWDIHFDYLIQDEVISEDEDKEYFQSEEYRSVIKDHMLRNIDKHHLAYFVEDHIRLGAVSYCTYQSEDGTCFIMDFWVFPQFRGNGIGHRCFDALASDTQKDGAFYYEINCDGRDDRMRFWKSLGFVERGLDEYGVNLLIKDNMQ